MLEKDNEKERRSKEGIGLRINVLIRREQFKTGKFESNFVSLCLFKP